MADAVNILRRAKNADKAPLFEPYSKVIVHAGLSSDGKSEVIYVAGNDSGRTLEVSNEWGTQMMADTILAKIKGFQYQPFQAQKALVDPSVELGDGITVNGIYSGIFAQATQFGALMQSNISAPVDEEIEHEYGFESKTDRAYTRMVAQTRSGITQNANEIELQVEEIRHDTTDTTNNQSLASRIIVNAESITQEVQERKNADNELSSSLEETATEIRASVVAKTGGTRTSFAWDLQADHFSLISNNKEVFRADSSGITVTGNGSFSGEIKASSGNIGNLTLANGALYTNGKTGIDTDVNGIYISSDGISLGRGNFKVTSQGTITAKSGTVGGFTITNNSIYNGMTSFSDTTHDGVYIGTSGIALGKGAFKVTSGGQVTASNLSITGGSININNGAFSVDANGNLTANNGTFGGNVYAKNIQYGGSAGTLNGSALTPLSVSGGTNGQIQHQSIGSLEVAANSISGGAGGHLKSNTLTDLNVVPNTYAGGGLSTSSLASSIGESLGLADLFGNAKTSASRLDYFKSAQLVATTSVYSPKYWCADTSGGSAEVNLVGHYHSLTESNGKIVLGAPHNDSSIDRRSFSIADTKYFKDFVEALNVTLTRTYPEDGINYYPYYNSPTYGKIIEFKVQYVIKDGDNQTVNSGAKVMNVPADQAYDAGEDSVAVSSGRVTNYTFNSYTGMYNMTASISLSNGKSDQVSLGISAGDAINYGKSLSAGYTNVSYSCEAASWNYSGGVLQYVRIAVYVRGYDKNGNYVTIASGYSDFRP